MSDSVVSLGAASDLLRNGDALFFRGRGIVSKLIGTASRSPYTHVGMFVRFGSVPMIAEVREFRGGRAVTLESQVRAFPGQIHAYAVDTDRFANFNRTNAALKMLVLTGCEYGYWSIVKAALRHLPFLRLWFA